MDEVDLGIATVRLTEPPVSMGKPTSFTPQVFRSAKALTEKASFNIMLPSNTLPDHDFLDGALLQQPAPAAALTYVERGTGRNYIVFQSPLATDEAKPEIRAVGNDLGMVTVGGGPAAVVTGNSPSGTPQPLTLVWTKAGIVIQVTGLDYSLETLKAIGDSI